MSAGLWAAIGTGLGAAVRKQVPAVVGVCAWVLFVEQVLLGEILGDIGRVTPGALSRAATIENPSVSPLLAVVLLSLYAIAAAGAGWFAIGRRDVA